MIPTLPSKGEEIITQRTYTQSLVKEFADLSGDINPVHLDEQFAATTLFKRPLAHGMLVASQISAALAQHLPGPGSIYLQQSMNFRKPVFWNDTIYCKITVVNVVLEKSLITLSTICYNENNEVVIEGEALIKKI
jgi:3-hydroxybutyryl-CoA dehydratase